MKRTLLFLIVLSLTISAGFMGCAHDKNVQNDSFFEKWKLLAEESAGHSPGTVKTENKVSSIEASPDPDTKNSKR